MTALFLIWIFFNGRIAWDVIIVGIAICLLMGLLLKKAMDYSLKKEIRFILRLPHLLRFIAVLIKEIIISNIQVIKIILDPWSRLQSQLYFFTPDLKTDIGRVLLANIITLTPGTNTVQLKNGRLCIHVLNNDFADGLETSALNREVKRLEEKFGDD